MGLQPAVSCHAHSNKLVSTMACITQQTRAETGLGYKMRMAFTLGTNMTLTVDAFLIFSVLGTLLVLIPSPDASCGHSCKVCEEIRFAYKYLN